MMTTSFDMSIQCSWMVANKQRNMTESVQLLLEKNIHWLPIKARIDIKILVLAWTAYNGIGPKYLSELLDKITQHTILIQLIQTY